jgi:hypothetical protein
MGGQPVSRVYPWLTNLKSHQSKQLLRSTATSPYSKRWKRSCVARYERQRGDVFGTAQQMASSLGSS